MTRSFRAGGALLLPPFWDLPPGGGADNKEDKHDHQDKCCCHNALDESVVPQRPATRSQCRTCKLQPPSLPLPLPLPPPPPPAGLLPLADLPILDLALTYSPGSQCWAVMLKRNDDPPTLLTPVTLQRTHNSMPLSMAFLTSAIANLYGMTLPASGEWSTAMAWVGVAEIGSPLLLSSGKDELPL